MMDDFSGMPIEDFWQFRQDESIDEDVTGGVLSHLKISGFPSGNWRVLRYRVTPAIALRAFHQLVDIGASVDGHEGGVKSLWLDFFHEFGIVGGHGNDNWDITLDVKDLLIMPRDAWVCYTLAKAIKNGDLKTIKSLATYEQWVDDTGRLIRWVTFVNHSRYHTPDQYFTTRKGLSFDLSKGNKSAWLRVAQEWLEEVLEKYTGGMNVHIKNGRLSLTHDGLQSAMWFAFWNSTQSYPHPVIKYCRECRQPIGSDNTRARKCDDCKRKARTSKTARYRAKKKAVGSTEGFM